MSDRNFRELLQTKWDQGRFVCVGLDSECDKIPECAILPSVRGTIFEFNKTIVEATKDLVCAYKLQAAFYEALGDVGWMALRETVAHIHKSAPDVPVILDAKRGDIGNTNNGYVEMAFGFLGVDAITVHPYTGQKSLQPFLDRADKGIFVLCRTSNPGAGEFQDLPIDPVYVASQTSYPRQYEGECRFPLYRMLAHRVAKHWNENRNCGLVVGATCPEKLRAVREIVGDMPILIPGIGAQGGDLEATVKAGQDSRGQGMIINSSRGVIFASSGPDFAEVARRETEKLHRAISDILGSKSRKEIKT